MHSSPCRCCSSGQPERLAVLGNAGGTIARAFGSSGPDVAIDGVEIDPAVSEAGRRYLGLADNPRLEVHDADARPFLRRTDRRYDLIYVDAYHQPYVRSISRPRSSSGSPGIGCGPAGRSR